MKFQVGKYYRHASGSVIHILAQVDNCTGYFNPCLVAEEPGYPNFLPYSAEVDATENWQEIPAHEYYRVWLVGNEGSKELQKLATPPPDAIETDGAL